MQTLVAPVVPAPPRPVPPDLDAILAFAAELESTATDLERRLATTLQQVSAMHWSSPAALACRGAAQASALDLRTGWESYRAAAAALRRHATTCQAAFDTSLAQWQRDRSAGCAPVPAGAAS